MADDISLYRVQEWLYREHDLLVSIFDLEKAAMTPLTELAASPTPSGAVGDLPLPELIAELTDLEAQCSINVDVAKAGNGGHISADYWHGESEAYRYVLRRLDRLTMMSY